MGDSCRSWWGGTCVDVADSGDHAIMEEYLKLKQLVEEVAEDIYKAVGGNKAAGTRVRKVMQDIKNVAQEVRKKVLDLRQQEGSQKPGT